MEYIKFGNVEIREIVASVNKDSATYGLRAFVVYVDGKRQSTLRCNEIDLVVLHAISLKREGINGQFGHYAGNMLNINEEIWTGS